MYEGLQNPPEWLLGPRTAPLTLSRQSAETITWRGEASFIS